MEIESGLAFLSRIKGSKFDISRLNSTLFPCSTSAPQIIEISGDAGLGKTLLCLDVLVSSLLPEKWFGINLGGLESSSIFIDCDHHFNIQQLQRMIQKRLEDKCLDFKNNCVPNLEHLDSEVEHYLNLSPALLLKEMERLTLKCLDNLIYLECSNSQQYVITLLTLNQLINNSKKTISLVIVDSISSFYWFDRVYRCESWAQTEFHFSTLFQCFFNSIKTNHMFAICTRQNLFNKRYVSSKTDNHASVSNQSEVEYKFLGKDWFKGLDWKIVLLQDAETSVAAVAGQAQVTVRIKVYKKNSLFNIVTCRFEKDKVSWFESKVDCS